MAGLNEGKNENGMESTVNQNVQEHQNHSFGGGRGGRGGANHGPGRGGGQGPRRFQQGPRDDSMRGSDKENDDKSKDNLVGIDNNDISMIVKNEDNDKTEDNDVTLLGEKDDDDDEYINFNEDMVVMDEYKLDQEVNEDNDVVGEKDHDNSVVCGEVFNNIDKIKSGESEVFVKGPIVVSEEVVNLTDQNTLFGTNQAGEKLDNNEVNCQVNIDLQQYVRNGELVNKPATSDISHNNEKRTLLASLPQLTSLLETEAAPMESMTGKRKRKRSRRRKPVSVQSLNNVNKKIPLLGSGPKMILHCDPSESGNSMASSKIKFNWHPGTSEASSAMENKPLFYVKNIVKEIVAEKKEKGRKNETVEDFKFIQKPPTEINENEVQVHKNKLKDLEDRLRERTKAMHSSLINPCPLLLQQKVGSIENLYLNIPIKKLFNPKKHSALSDDMTAEDGSFKKREGLRPKGGKISSNVEDVELWHYSLRNTLDLLRRGSYWLQLLLPFCESKGEHTVMSFDLVERLQQLTYTTNRLKAIVKSNESVIVKAKDVELLSERANCLLSEILPDQSVDVGDEYNIVKLWNSYISLVKNYGSSLFFKYRVFDGDFEPKHTGYLKNDLLNLPWWSDYHELTKMRQLEILRIRDSLKVAEHHKANAQGTAKTKVKKAVKILQTNLQLLKEIDKKHDRLNQIATFNRYLSSPDRVAVENELKYWVSSVRDESSPGGRAGNQQGGGGRGGRGGFRGQNRGGGGDERGGGRGPDDRLNEKLMAIAGPTVDLAPQDQTEKKFTGRCRLYIGNLNNDITDDEINALFAPYGETSETFVNKEKNFAFIRLDYRANAEKAKRELDGQLRKGRPLKVRFAPLGAAVKAKNLTPWVSNELLEYAFSAFGEVERAVVISDERGNSHREGIIEFSRKPSALLALRRCSEGCFFLTGSLRPVILEPYEPLDDIDGYPEKNLPKKNPEYFKAREVGPRFASVGGFEFEYGTRWKQLHELYKQKEEALTREMKMEEEKLEAQMEYARYEHETEILREQLRQRELDRERQKREWEMKERQAEEQRRSDEDMMRRQQEEMQLRMHHQEDELRRRQQENSIFMQEQALRQSQVGGTYSTPPVQDGAAIREYEAMAAAAAGGTGAIPPDPKAYMEAYERGARYEGARGALEEARRADLPPQRGRWGPPADRRGAAAEDYPPKRRRY